MTALLQRPVGARQHVPLGIRGWWNPRRVPSALLLCAGVAIVVCAFGSVFAQQDFIDRQYQIKAAYLYNFAKYVEWPAGSLAAAADNRSAFVIAVVGEDPFGASLVSIARRKKIRGESIIVRQFPTANEYKPCHLLFIPAAGSPELVSQVLERAQGGRTLIVGETDGFAENGGHFNFYIESNKVKFEINRDAVARTELKVSSKLYHLARIVHDKPR